AAAVAAQEHLASGAPTLAQILRQPDHRRPIEFKQEPAEALRVALEVLRGGFAAGRAERVLHGSVHGPCLECLVTLPGTCTWDLLEKLLCHCGDEANQTRPCPIAQAWPS